MAFDENSANFRGDDWLSRLRGAWAVLTGRRRR